jgi:hypothetical protein
MVFTSVLPHRVNLGLHYAIICKICKPPAAPRSRTGSVSGASREVLISEIAHIPAGVNMANK